MTIICSGIIPSYFITLRRLLYGSKFHNIEIWVLKNSGTSEVLDFRDFQTSTFWATTTNTRILYSTFIKNKHKELQLAHSLPHLRRNAVFLTFHFYGIFQNLYHYCVRNWYRASYYPYYVHQPLTKERLLSMWKVTWKSFDTIVICLKNPAT